MPTGVLYGWLQKRGGGHWSNEYRRRWFVLGADGEAVRNARNWPVGPDDFDDLIETKVFTNAIDASSLQGGRRRVLDGGWLVL